MTRQTTTEHGPGGSTAGTIFYILLGPILWAAHFTLIYFAQSMLCAHGLAGSGVVPTIVGIATLVVLGAIGAALLSPHAVRRLMHAGGWSDAELAFHTRLMMGLAVLSAAAIAWAGLAAVVIPSCPLLR